MIYLLNRIFFKTANLTENNLFFLYAVLVFTTDVTGSISSFYLFSSSVHRKFPSRVLRIIESFWTNVRFSFKLFLASSGFLFGNLPEIQFLPLCLITESWALTLTEACDAHSALDDVWVLLWTPGWVVDVILK